MIRVLSVFRFAKFAVLKLVVQLVWQPPIGNSLRVRQQAAEPFETGCTYWRRHLDEFNTRRRDALSDQSFSMLSATGARKAPNGSQRDLCEINRKLFAMFLFWLSFS